jgi:hypothetical protein
MGGLGFVCFFYLVGGRVEERTGLMAEGQMDHPRSMILKLLTRLERSQLC